MKTRFILIFTSFILLYVSKLMAAPWVDTSDIYLRSDIQALADAGVITVPTNTFPLMWAGIGKDLEQVEPEMLSPALVEAFARVNFYYRKAILNRGNTAIKAAVATDKARFQHFGSNYRDKGELTISHEYTGSWYAYKLSTSANYDKDNDKKFNFDDSYIAAIYGNWVLSAGTIEQWWGPGFDSALHKSNNARPMPSVYITRNDAHAFATPWLSWIGPWTFTAGFSHMDDERAVKNALLWNFRGSIRPIKQLELGLSWTTQFCGEGQECNFFKVMAGKPQCVDQDCIFISKPGNHIAGYDVRYSDTLFNIPFGIYLYRIGEDGNPLKVTDNAKLIGMDTHWGDKDTQYKAFFEYTDTLVACYEGNSNSFNCYYEHYPAYFSGYRYHKKSIGSTYDSDANTYVLGLTSQFKNSHALYTSIKYAELNKDGENPIGDLVGWVPAPKKENLLMLELSYRFPLIKGIINLGGNISHSQLYKDAVTKESTETNAVAYATYEYRF